VDRVDELRRVVRTDADPRVRRRAQMVLLLSEGETVSAVARLFRAARHRVRRWRDAWMARGRDGLADAPRTGRPPKLSAEDLALLADALERGPQAYGWPVAVWSVRDLVELLRQQRGTEVGVPTLHRAVLGLGYRYRRPRLDLRHRQDAEAVASARSVLEWLGKGPAPGSCTSSTPTSARSTGTHGWRASGSAGAAG
jgi:transposase